jgi:hypothetical protein
MSQPMGSHRKLKRGHLRHGVLTKQRHRFFKAMAQSEQALRLIGRSIRI